MAIGQKGYGAVQLIGWLFGIPILIASALATAPALTSSSWPTTSGTVQSTAYVYSNRGGNHWQINVGYKVGDDSHVCHDVAFTAGPPTHSQIDRYSLRSTVEVHYKPNDPAKCVLEPGISSPLVLSWLAAIALLAAALYARSRTPMYSVNEPSSAGLTKSGGNFTKAPEPRELADVASLVRQNRTIEAIKLYRKLTGSGLKEAKDYIDRLPKD